MFGTLRYDSHNDRTEFLDRSARFHVNEQNGFSGQHAACDLCRAKKLRCSGQEHGCDRCKTSSSSCVYSTSRDDGRQKRRRRADNGSTSKNNHEQAIGSTPSVPGAGSAAPPKGYASEREPNLANNTTILPQPEQELQGSMEISGQSHETAQEISVPPEGKDLLEGLESEFDLVDGGIFDAIPTLNLYTPKSLNESSGNIEKLDMVHDMGFLPRTAQSEAARTRNWDMSPPPSATVTQSSRDISLEHSEWLLSSPSFHLDPSASERPLQPISRQTFTKPPATPPSCACLVTKVSLLEQLGSHPVDDSLDEVLAVHKTCLGKCWSILGCGLCMSKSESRPSSPCTFETQLFGPRTTSPGVRKVPNRQGRRMGLPYGSINLVSSQSVR